MAKSELEILRETLGAYVIEMARLNAKVGHLEEQAAQQPKRKSAKPLKLDEKAQRPTG